VDEGGHLSAFYRLTEEGSDRERWRNGWRWRGASMASVVEALKRGAERMGRGTMSRRGGQAAWSTQLPWAQRRRSEASGCRLRWPKVAAAAAAQGRRR
jgi:hypothetical protein